MQSERKYSVSVFLTKVKDLFIYIIKLFQYKKLFFLVIFVKNERNKIFFSVKTFMVYLKLLILCYALYHTGVYDWWVNEQKNIVPYLRDFVLTCWGFANSNVRQK